MKFILRSKKKSFKKFFKTKCSIMLRLRLRIFERCPAIWPHLHNQSELPLFLMQTACSYIYDYIQLFPDDWYPKPCFFGCLHATARKVKIYFPDVRILNFFDRIPNSDATIINCYVCTLNSYDYTLNSYVRYSKF